MIYLTAEKICKLGEMYSNSNLGFKRVVNKLFKAQDDSHKWPIKNAFNATNRAIGRAKRYEKQSGIELTGLEYCYFVESEISKIINSEAN